MFSVTAVAMHLVPYAVDSIDVSLTLAGSLMTLLAVCMVIGQNPGRCIDDQVSKRTCMVILALTCVSVVLLGLVRRPRQLAASA